MKRGRLLVSAGCVVQLPLRVVYVASCAEVFGAKASIARLRDEMFASDVHLVWLTTMGQGVSLNRLTDWLKFHGWMNERVGDLDLVGIDCVHLLDSKKAISDLCLEADITHAVVDGPEWTDAITMVPNRYMLLGQGLNSGDPSAWISMERRILNE